MWAHIDPAVKQRLENEYEVNKVQAAKDKEEY